MFKIHNLLFHENNIAWHIALLIVLSKYQWVCPPAIYWIAFQGLSTAFENMQLSFEKTANSSSLL